MKKTTLELTILGMRHLHDGYHEGDTHNGFSVQVPTYWNITGCQGSNWLYAFKGIRIPLKG